MEMPGLSGPETARLIRAQEKERGEGKRLPVLALTANTRPEAIDACLQAGMDGHLPKPFDAVDLETEMQRLTALSAA
jgi:CheY-like chemotaxis protein